MLRASARLALAFGTFLAVGELVRNWGDWQWWPFWVVDYIEQRPLTLVIGVLFGLSILGFLGAVLSARRADA